jgi:hypothetical protein
MSKYSKDFFKNKKILELGPFNGYIGNFFSNLKADVHCVEGRHENVEYIKETYPNLKVTLFNLDCKEWNWEKYDIIINFGLYYHLQNFHKEHLENCIYNCNLMFFESVVYDSFESEIFFYQEKGIDQSLSNVGGNPSTSYIENIFKQNNIKFEKFSNSCLNGNGHIYDWKDENSKVLHRNYRRFWIADKQ